MKQPNHLIVFSLMLCVVLLASAQQPKPDTLTSAKQVPPAKTEPAASNENDRREKPAKKVATAELTQLQLRGLGLIRETGREAVRLDDKRSATLIQATAADLLWDYDEERAKEFFAYAFELGTNYYLESKDNNRRQVSKTAYITRKDVLLEVIRLVNKHEPDLASSYTDKYIEAKNRFQSAPQGGSAQSMNQLMGDNQPAAAGLWKVALSFLESDRKLSIEIAGRALMLAVTTETAFYLTTLAGQDRQLADQLYIRALARLVSDVAPLPGALSVLMDYPFATGSLRFVDGKTNSKISYLLPPNVKLDPQLVNQFLATAFTVLTRVSGPATLQLPDGISRINLAFYLAKFLAPKVKEFQPGSLEQWQALINQLTTAVEVSTRSILEETAARDASPRTQTSTINQQEYINDTLSRAEKATDVNQRDKLYSQAAILANQAGDSEKAVEIAGKIIDLSMRRQVKSWIGIYAAERALGAGKFEDARRYALEVDAIDERAYLLSQIAAALQKEKAVARSSEILEEALRLAQAADNTPNKYKALVSIANIFAAVDFARGYEALEAGVKVANQLPIATPLTPDDTHLVRVFESERGSANNSRSIAEFELGATLVKLAKGDLERGLSLLNTLDNLPLRYIATLTLAGTLLQSAGRASVQ
jgi:hypothetical protein